jgi:PAS domain-containing protein
VRLFVYGGEVHLAMVVMLALFMGALTVVARNVHRALVHAFRLRFENAALLEQVSAAQASLVSANEQLSGANQLLERRVRERTAELRESQQQLAEIVRESPDGIIIIDESGSILSASPAVERISGRSADGLIGTHFADTDALLGDDMGRAIAAFQDVIQGERRPPE